MKKRFSVATAPEKGANGKVHTPRKTFSIKEGQSVDISAESSRGSIFAGWRYPNGQIEYWGYRLRVDHSFQEGTYAAVFRKPKNCAAPALQLPKNELTWTEGKTEKLTLRVNADAYPVTFSCKGLPPGMHFLQGCNTIFGQPLTNGTWRVKVMARGVSRKLPVATGAFTVKVSPAPRSEDGNDAAERDNNRSNGHEQTSKEK